MPTFMGLGTWAAFTESKNGAMVMGDTVLFEDEVNPAMSAALDAGLSVTALHNHFFFDHPKVYFMHLEGQRTVEELATVVRKVYDKIKEIRVGGISIVAIHSHMTHEQPRILFFHYWGRGPAKKLAEAIQGALLAAGLSGVSSQAQN